MAIKAKLTKREIHRRLVADRTFRTLYSREKSKQKRRLGERGHFHSRFESKNKLPADKKKSFHIDLMVPEELDLIKNFDETTEFIHDIRTIALKEKRPVRLVFDNVKRIKPAALLLLLAELHRARLIHGPIRVTGTYPKEKRLEKMLSATGFFSILGVAPRNKNKTNTQYPLEYIKFVSEDRTTQGTARRLREQLFGDVVTIEPKPRRQLSRAIDEAMLNAGQHAYPLGSLNDHPEKGRWWLAGHVNKRSGELMVMFCDLGVGIPRTLPKRYPIELILAALSYVPGIRPNDAEMIQAGMTIGRTRTKEENRGKGLNDLRRFIDESGIGELHIFSRKGHFHYKPGHEEKLRNSDTSVGGTLIQWSVPLKEISNWTGVAEDETDSNN